MASMEPMPNSQNNVFEIIVGYFFANIQCMVTPSKLNELEHLNIADSFRCLNKKPEFLKMAKGNGINGLMGMD